MSTLDDWLQQAARTVGLPEDPIDATLRTELLDLTRDVAHGVTRIAGPLTTYLAGIAVGAGMTPAEAVRLLTESAATHIAGSGEDDPGEPEG